MRGFGLIILAFGFLAGTESFSQEAPGDKEKIQGTWKVVSQEGYVDTKLVRVVITADKLTFEHTKGNLPPVGYQLDSSKKPKAIDMLTEKGAKPIPGIYLLDGDDLKLCWDANSKSRPTEFSKDGKGGRDPRLLVLKREKKK